jgi:hypothetical protein
LNYYLILGISNDLSSYFITALSYIKLLNDLIVYNNLFTIFYSYWTVQRTKTLSLLYVQSTTHQTIHFGLWNALISRVYALIFNCNCTAWCAVDGTMYFFFRKSNKCLNPIWKLTRKYRKRRLKLRMILIWMANCLPKLQCFSCSKLRAYLDLDIFELPQIQPLLNVNIQLWNYIRLSAYFPTYKYALSSTYL